MTKSISFESISSVESVEMKLVKKMQEAARTVHSKEISLHMARYRLQECIADWQTKCAKAIGESDDIAQDQIHIEGMQMKRKPTTTKKPNKK